MAQRCRASSQIISVFCYKNVKKVKDCILMRNEMQCDARKSAGRGTTRPASSRFQPVRVADRRTNCNRQRCCWLLRVGCFGCRLPELFILHLEVGQSHHHLRQPAFPGGGDDMGQAAGRFCCEMQRAKGTTIPVRDADDAFLGSFCRRRFADKSRVI